MAGLLFLWLVIKLVFGDLRKQRVTLFSNNPPYGWMGAPFSNTRLDGVCAPHPGTSTQAKIKWDMPNNSTPHRGRGELDDGYPFTLFWEQTKMVLQN